MKTEEILAERKTTHGDFDDIAGYANLVAD